MHYIMFCKRAIESLDHSYAVFVAGHEDGMRHETRHERELQSVEGVPLLLVATPNTLTWYKSKCTVSKLNYVLSIVILVLLQAE